MMKKWFEKILEITKTLTSRVWEKFKFFWFTIALPWLKDLTPGKRS